ncbi:sporulation integral membrane protein YtvI [Virgibacillus sp. W0181]|uniref:sporulation integral membrane protein YtvI n=1 Tax=Virgibacillus sp. W0181 TaxID=3391581 RepID=UPI003F48863F
MDVQHIMRFLRFTLVVILFISVFYLLKYTLIFLYPFIIAVLISLMLNPVVTFLHKKWRIPRSMAIIGTLIFILVFFISVIVLVIAEVIQGTTYLAETVPVYIKELFNLFHLFLENTIFPIYHKLNEFIETLDTSYQTTVENYIQQLLDTVASTGAKFLQDNLLKTPAVLATLPRSAGMFIIAMLGTFLILHDWDRLSHLIKRAIPNFINLSHYYFHLKRAFTGFFAAQLILVFITGLIIFIGLVLIDVEHVLTITIITMFVDLFPYIGVGLLFIPWIIYLFLSQQYALTIYLSILYISIIIFRQILEPKMLSSKIGINPLFALITLFIGYQLWGIGGILLTPLILICAGACYQAGLVDQILSFIKG